MRIARPRPTNQAPRCTLALCLALLVLGACNSPSDEQSPPPAVDMAWANPEECSPQGHQEVWARRIEPLTSADRPSSCSSCHLPGIDLSAFLGDDPCQTMACLLDDDLVDLQAPRASRVMGWIARAHQSPNAGDFERGLADAEQEAFAQWIAYNARCGAQICAPVDNPCGRPAPEPDMAPRDMGSADMDMGTADMPCDGGDCADACGEGGCLPTLDEGGYGCEVEGRDQAFVDYIWPTIGRCSHCHSPSGQLSERRFPPHWISEDTRSREGAQETIANLRAEPMAYFDFAEPSQSPMLLKPLHEDAGGVMHGGGPKIRDEDDEMYQAMLGWIRLEATCLE